MFAYIAANISSKDPWAFLGVAVPFSSLFNNSIASRSSRAFAVIDSNFSI